MWSLPPCSKASGRNKFTNLPLWLIFGGRIARTQHHAESNPSFFTIANYEQIIRDSFDLNNLLRSDIIVPDEAQRITKMRTEYADYEKRVAELIYISKRHRPDHHSFTPNPSVVAS